MSKPGLQKMRKAAGWKSARAFAEHIGMPVDTQTECVHFEADTQSRR